MKRRVQSRVTMQKVVPNVTNAYRKLWDIPENHGDVAFSWSRYGVLSGETVSDVQSGIHYVKDYIENKTACYVLDEEGTLEYCAFHPMEVE